MEEKPFALITGTSGGLGFKMAQFLLAEGFFVIGISRRETLIDHSHFIDILCDIKDEASVEEMYELVSEHTKKLQIIILNAAIFEISPLIETSTKEFVDHLMTNVVGAFHILKHAQDFLIENKTHIITISSIASKIGLANISAYSASKFALNGMIQSLKAEWAYIGVRFSTLMPGAIATPLWSEEDREALSEQMLSMQDFMHVFEMVVRSPSRMQFPEIVFLHKNGSLK